MIKSRTSSASGFSPTRRSFIKAASAGSAGLVLGFTLGCSKQEKAASVAKDVAETPEIVGRNLEPNAFVRISPGNQVFVTIKHLEMGQGAFTGLASCVADELGASWEQVVCEAAPGDMLKYGNAAFGGAQLVGGSNGMSSSFQQMRLAGGAARNMLVNAAANKWGINAADISINNGVISDAAGNSATLGEFADLAVDQAIPADDAITLKSAREYVFIGNPDLPRKDIGKRDGSAVFTQDMQLEGMLTAVVARSPRFGGKVKSYDASAASEISGVEKVVEIPSGVAVIAKDFWTAKKAREKLSIDWDDTQAEMRGSKDLMSEFSALADTPGNVARQEGDALAVLDKADEVMQFDFEFPYLSHAPIEPMNCVIQVNPDGVEMWFGSQGQTIDQGAVAATLGLTPQDVHINTLYAGGSFGRRGNPHADYSVEAANIASNMPGTPIKLVRSREDDIRCGYFRPAYIHKASVSVNEQGEPEAWLHRVVGQSIMAGTAFAEQAVQNGVDPSSVEGLTEDFPYRVANHQVELHSPEVGVPVQWWRSVGHTHTAYAKEVIIDQLAKAAGKDPLEYRLALIEDDMRYANVLRNVAVKSGWGNWTGGGRAQGIAAQKSFGSYVAQVVDITVAEDRTFEVNKVTSAVDCGIAVNPDIVKAQIEGGAIMGLSAAMGEEITLTGGEIDQSNFHDYRLLRMDQTPEVETHIVASSASPTGVGEPGLPPVAPALANALAVIWGVPPLTLPIKS